MDIIRRKARDFQDDDGNKDHVREVFSMIPEADARERAVTAIWSGLRENIRTAPREQLVDLEFCSDIMMRDRRFDFAAQLIIAAMTPQTLRIYEQHWLPFLFKVPEKYWQAQLVLQHDLVTGDRITVPVRPRPSIESMLDAREPHVQRSLLVIMTKAMQRWHEKVVQEQRALEAYKSRPQPTQAFNTADVFSYVFERIPASPLRSALVHEVVLWTLFCYARDTGKYMFVNKVDFPNLPAPEQPRFPSMESIIEAWQSGAIPSGEGRALSRHTNTTGTTTDTSDPVRL